MDVFTTPDSMRAWSRRHRAAGSTIAVVPTMGALHEGHFGLMAAGRAAADLVIVTIFVNPLQFNETTDFDSYPRPIEDDTRACEAHGADAVYAPTSAIMYPPGFQTHVEPGALADALEGPMRPGHFQGVTTAVTKLFGATVPDVGVFGQKDFQQLAIIRRMVADLNLGVDIIAVPTVREPDGLARSSRNVRLTANDRRAALAVPRSLQAAADVFAAGSRSPSDVRRAAVDVLTAEPAARLEYVEVCDIATLGPLTQIEHGCVVLTAVWFGDVRLIDNRVLTG